MIKSMTYKGYTASMVFDTEDRIIVGRVHEIDDIISFHGESIAEFESNFHAAIEDYLAASKEFGSAPERPASGKVMLRIAPEVHAAARKAAARSGTSANRAWFIFEQLGLSENRFLAALEMTSDGGVEMTNGRRGDRPVAPTAPGSFLAGEKVEAGRLPGELVVRESCGGQSAISSSRDATAPAMRAGSTGARRRAAPRTRSPA
jgi:predicted HicB family RNase H-like nuclease